jgi:hypothetical protein
MVVPTSTLTSRRSGIKLTENAYSLKCIDGARVGWSATRTELAPKRRSSKIARRPRPEAMYISSNATSGSRVHIPLVVGSSLTGPTKSGGCRTKAGAFARRSSGRNA